MSRVAPLALLGIPSAALRLSRVVAGPSPSRGRPVMAFAFRVMLSSGVFNASSQRSLKKILGRCSAPTPERLIAGNRAKRCITLRGGAYSALLRVLPRFWFLLTPGSAGLAPAAHQRSRPCRVACWFWRWHPGRQPEHRGGNPEKRQRCDAGPTHARPCQSPALVSCRRA